MRISPKDLRLTHGSAARRTVRRRIGDRSATAAGAASATVAATHAGTTLEPPLVLLRPGHPQPEGRRARALVPDPDVVDLAPALHLAPAVGEQVLVPSGGSLAELVRVRHLDEQALAADLLVAGHGGKGSRADYKDPRGAAAQGNRRLATKRSPRRSAAGDRPAGP